MTTYIVKVPNNKSEAVLNVLKELPFLKVKEQTDSKAAFKEKIKKSLTQALKEVDLMEKGELKKEPIEDLLDELRNEKRKKD